MPTDSTIYHLVEIGLLIIAILTFYFQRQTERRESKQSANSLLTEQVKMHTENKQKLEQLQEFNRIQVSVNDKRDEQISDLKTLASTTVTSLQGINRRLELVENKLNN